MLERPPDEVAEQAVGNSNRMMIFHGTTIFHGIGLAFTLTSSLCWRQLKLG